MKIIALLLLAYLLAAIVINLNTLFAHSRQRSEWRLGRWFNQKWIRCWVRLSWVTFVGTIIFVVVAGLVADAAEAPVIGYLIDAWFWTRIPVWFVLTARRKRQVIRRPSPIDPE